MEYCLECRKREISDNHHIDMIQAMMFWQTDINVQPIRCENIIFGRICNQMMLPSVEHGVVVFKCPCCSNIRENISTELIEHYFRHKFNNEEPSKTGDDV